MDDGPEETFLDHAFTLDSPDTPAVQGRGSRVLTAAFVLSTGLAVIALAAVAVVLLTTVILTAATLFSGGKPFAPTAEAQALSNYFTGQAPVFLLLLALSIGAMLATGLPVLLRRRRHVGHRMGHRA